MSKSNRKFYEFYQEIEKILTSTRDLHFNIYAHQTPKGIKFGQYFVADAVNFNGVDGFQPDRFLHTGTNIRYLF